jgi:hypothetical protein
MITWFHEVWSQVAKSQFRPHSHTEHATLFLLWWCPGFWRSVDSLVDADVSEKIWPTYSLILLFLQPYINPSTSQPRNFSSEDGESMFLQNVGIYLRVSTATKPRASSSSSPPWEPQIAHVSSLLWHLSQVGSSTSLNVPSSDSVLLIVLSLGLCTYIVFLQVTDECNSVRVKRSIITCTLHEAQIRVCQVTQTRVFLQTLLHNI